MTDPVRQLFAYIAGLRIKENKEVYEGEVTELTPEETENQVCTIPTWCLASQLGLSLLQRQAETIVYAAYYMLLIPLSTPITCMYVLDAHQVFVSDEPIKADNGNNLKLTNTRHHTHLIADMCIM